MGMYLSRANTFALIDEDAFMRELWVRDIRCEIEGCTSLAVGVMSSVAPGIVCAKHKAEYDAGGASAQFIIKALQLAIEATVLQVARAAYAGQEDDIMFQSDGTSLLEQARMMARGASEIVSSSTPSPPAPRKPLATLESDNAAPIILDVFVL
jgi:hypothetical protein